MARIDLQSHSTVSDGALAPAAVVGAAARAGVEVLALTDHDSVGGVPEALDAAQKVGIELVPAAELSAPHPEATDLHVLGYWLDVGSPALAAGLERARADRVGRAERAIEALRGEGFAVSMEAVRELAGGADSIGRPHLADAILAEPANAGLLRERAIDERGAFIRAYLIEGRPTFRSRTWPAPVEAVALIHAAGGVAVWAHPFWDVAAPDRVVAVIDELAAAGLGGVEAYYPTHSREQTELLVAECERRGLAATGSSDFHGPDHRHFSRFLAYETYGLPGPVVPDRPAAPHG